MGTTHLAGLPDVPSLPPLRETDCLRGTKRKFADWHRGVNAPHVSKAASKDGVLGEQAQEVLGNLHKHLCQPINLGHLADIVAEFQKRSARRRVKRFTIASLLMRVLGFESKKHVAADHVVAARLCGLRVRTTSNNLQQMSKRSWSTIPRKLRVGRKRLACVAAAESAASEGSENEALCFESGDVVGEVDSQVSLGCKTEKPETRPRCEENNTTSIGMRVGSLAAKVYIDPHFVAGAFPSIVSWADEHVPGSMGSTNHDKKFVKDFGRLLAVHLQTCNAMQHWQKIPALSTERKLIKICALVWPQKLEAPSELK